MYRLLSESRSAASHISNVTWRATVKAPELHNSSREALFEPLLVGYKWECIRRANWESIWEIEVDSVRYLLDRKFQLCSCFQTRICALNSH